MKTKTKVLIVGLDGATFDLIKPWLLQGKLPNFSHLLEEGSHSELRSTIPSLTSTSWTSFITGCNPGKHGIYDFKEYLPGSYDGPLINSTRIAAPTLWEILGSQDKRIGLINVPLTYPPPHINGFIISGIPAPDFGDKTTFPSELASELKNEVREYEIDLPWDEIKKSKNAEFLLEGLAKFNSFREEATLYFLNRHNWDFLMTVFMGIDRVQHFFWDCLDSDHPAFNQEKKRRYGSVILNFYQKADTFLGKLLKNLDEDTVIMVVSDHGSCPAHKLVYFDKWLIDQGLMTVAVRNDSPVLYDFLVNFPDAGIEAPGSNYVGITSFAINKESREVLFSHPPSTIEYEVRIPQGALLTLGIGLNPDVWSAEKGEGVSFQVNLETQTQNHRLYSKYIDPKNNPLDRKWFNSVLDLSRFAGQQVLLKFRTSTGPSQKNIYNWAGWSNLRITRNSGKNVPEKSSGLIDWPKTKAYWGIGLGIRVNLKGREPQGIVEPGPDYEKLREYIIKNLEKLKEPATGKLLVDKVLKREELYAGRCVDNAPDLLVILKDKNYVPPRAFKHNSLIESSLEWGMAGAHSPNGILIAKGKVIKRREQLKNAQITDLAPTILYLLNIPVPEYMDGRVLTELFEESTLESGLPKSKELYSRKEIVKSLENVFTAEETETICERLRGLGYLG